MDKVCTQCRESKPASEFHNNRRSKDGLCSYCKSCANERTRQWHARNPDKANPKGDYVLSCPGCGDERHFRTRSTYYAARNSKSLCRKCAGKASHSPDILRDGGTLTRIVTCSGCGEQREVHADSARRLASAQCRRCFANSRRDDSIRYDGSRRLYRVTCPECGKQREVTGMDAARAKVCTPCAHGGSAYELVSDRDWLASQYEGHSVGEIARAVGYTYQSVHRWMHVHGIPMRTREEAQELRHRGEKKQVKLGRNRQMVTGGARQGVGFTTIPGVASDIYSLPHSEAT